MSTKKRVLIVDDSPTQARQLALVLQLAEFTVEVASNGKAALAALEKERFDLVMSDVLMPDINGYDLCQMIKEDPRWLGVPVILLTTLNEVEDIMKGLAAGADNFVAKPYETQSLLDRIRTVFNNRYDDGSSDSDNTEIEFRLLGKHYQVNATRQQIMAFLLATFEDYAAAKHKEKEALRREMERKRATSEILVKKNRELVKMNRRLEGANDTLARLNEELASAQKRLDNSFDEFKREQALHEFERERGAHRLRFARAMESMLIPRAVPRPRGLELAFGYRGGGESSGDWLDFWNDDTAGTTTVLLGDVGAHGAAAAVLSSAAHSCCTTFAHLYRAGSGAAPHERSSILLKHLNDTVCQMADGKYFMTFQATEIDRNRRLMRITNAGYAPPLIIRVGEIKRTGRSSRWRHVHSVAMPSAHLGERADSTLFPTWTVELGDGDVVVWMSNGVLLGQDYGERRLLSWICEVSDKPADKIRVHLERKILALLGKKLPEDDVLFVVARFAPGV